MRLTSETYRDEVCFLDVMVVKEGHALETDLCHEGHFCGLALRIHRIGSVVGRFQERS